MKEQMKKIITAALVCAMIISSLCGCVPEKEELPPLPQNYSLLDENRVTEPKDQHQTGMCAAYSSANICESALISDGLAKADGIDLSEAHTFYYLYSFMDEKDQASDSDAIYLSGSRKDSLNMMFYVGADPSMILNMYANGAGPANESVVQFDAEDIRKSAAEVDKAHTGGAMSKFTGDYLVTGINSYGPTTAGEFYECSSADEIKRAIVSDGAMLVGMFVEPDAYHAYEGGMGYHYQKKSDDDRIKVNHATTIIGWDDNYSRDNFGSVKPESNGAWLIQDSQGSDIGDNGCYWISYEEALCGFATADLCLREDYGDILFYDSLTMTEKIKSATGDTVTANVFVPEKACSLKAVGVQTAAKNQSLLIEVFRNPETGTPDSGECVATLKSIVDNAGYHVIDLESTVPFDSGDTFSVVVTYKAGKNDMTGSVPVEGEVNDNLDFFFVPVECVYSSGAGESFVMCDGKWYDTSMPATAELFGLDVTINNFGIKALMEKE